MTREELQRQIAINDRRLQKLKEQRALQGINTDPAVLIEIDDIETELETLYETAESRSKPARPEAA